VLFRTIVFSMLSVYGCASFSIEILIVRSSCPFISFSLCSRHSSLSRAFRRIRARQEARVKSLKRAATKSNVSR
jgi:hypothetical protein